MPPEAEGITEAIGLFAQIAESAGISPWAVDVTFIITFPILCWYACQFVMRRKFPPNGSAKKALAIAEGAASEIAGLKKQATTEHNLLREDIGKMSEKFTNEVNGVGESLNALRKEIHDNKLSDLEKENRDLKAAAAAAANSPPAPSQK